MKAIAVLGGISALVAATAVADPLRDDRDVVDASRHPCPKAIAFTDITKCLSKNVQPESVGTVPGARLVRLEVPERVNFAKLLLYIEEKGVWRVAGDWMMRDFTIVDFQPLTIGKHTGYRIDVGEAFDAAVNIEHVDEDSQAPLRPGLARISTSFFCGSAGLGCMRIVTECEVLVRGKARWMFHGRTKLEGNVVVVEGDRRQAGSWCNGPQNLFLRWPR